jgi:hypothetical protein
LLRCVLLHSALSVPRTLFLKQNIEDHLEKQVASSGDTSLAIGSANEIRTIGVEAFIHQQIDLREIYNTDIY